MGTPDFAKDSLEQLIKNNFEICGVVTQVDKPKGRGMKMIPCPVKEYALAAINKVAEEFKSTRAYQKLPDTPADLKKKKTKN